MNNKLTFSSHMVIGLMLFALFFGAGNLIFPAQLGQNAGTNLWPAVFGFLITGVGLPLLGILAMSFSKSNNLQELASRVHPAYGIFFTSLLYLTIGPFFASPRTGTVAYEVGIAGFVGENSQQGGLLIFTLIFFGLTLLFSLRPNHLVRNIGKFLAPGIVILLAVLLIFAIVNPMGTIQAPEEGFLEGPFIKGFLEGYNTMDALASLVFGIIVIKAIRSFGVTSRSGILLATATSGIVAILLLGGLYIGIAYLGATSTEMFGIFSNGGPVLSSAASYYLGNFGLIVLAIIMTLACLTTSIGLTVACAEYFHTLLPKISYQAFAIFFAVLTFVIANFGLTNIITFSVPVLMFLYPLAIVLMLLTFLSPLFKHSQVIYIIATVSTFSISIFDGLKELCHSLEIDYFAWMNPVLSFYERTLPLYSSGLGWFIPALLIIILGSLILFLQNVFFPARKDKAEVQG